MHAHTHCRYIFSCTKEEYEAMKSVISKAYLGFLEEPKENVIEVTETCGNVVWIEQVDDLAVEIAKAAPNASFVMDGTLDTREIAGHFINYYFEYQDGTLNCQYSSRYYVTNVDMFEDYGEYLEEFDSSHDDDYEDDDYDEDDDFDEDDEEDDDFDEDDRAKPLTQEEFEEGTLENEGEFYDLDEGEGDHALVVPFVDTKVIKITG